MNRSKGHWKSCSTQRMNPTCLWTGAKVMENHVQRWGSIPLAYEQVQRSWKIMFTSQDESHLLMQRSKGHGKSCSALRMNPTCLWTGAKVTENHVKLRGWIPLAYDQEQRSWKIMFNAEDEPHLLMNRSKGHGKSCSSHRMNPTCLWTGAKVVENHVQLRGRIPLAHEQEQRPWKIMFTSEDESHLLMNRSKDHGKSCSPQRMNPTCLWTGAKVIENHVQLRGWIPLASEQEQRSWKIMFNSEDESHLLMNRSNGHGKPCSTHRKENNLTAEQGRKEEMRDQVPDHCLFILWKTKLRKRPFHSVKNKTQEKETNFQMTDKPIITES